MSAATDGRVKVLIPLRVNCLFGPEITWARSTSHICLNPSQGQLPLRTVRRHDRHGAEYRGLNPSQGQLPLRTKTANRGRPACSAGLNPSQGQLPLRTSWKEFLDNLIQRS